LVLDRKPISVFLRERMTAAGRRAWANDNLSEFVGPIELDALENEVADRANDLLRALVIDTESDPNTRDTARRVARMFVREVFAGRYQPRPVVTEFEGIRQADDCFAIGPIAIRSCCAHHLVPITGQAWVGVIPNVENATVIGLSKYHRLTHWIMSRPQIQEEAVEQLADELEGAIGSPRALAVVVRSRHLCCGWRGVKDDASWRSIRVPACRR
jgi:GTP cyclohydrolase I